MWRSQVFLVLQERLVSTDTVAARHQVRKEKHKFFCKSWKFVKQEYKGKKMHLVFSFQRGFKAKVSSLEMLVCSFCFSMILFTFSLKYLLQNSQSSQPTASLQSDCVQAEKQQGHRDQTSMLITGHLWLRNHEAPFYSQLIPPDL